jgi:hypothetical protein
MPPYEWYNGYSGDLDPLFRFKVTPLIFCELKVLFSMAMLLNFSEAISFKFNSDSGMH